jgi:hypothetical protein
MIDDGVEPLPSMFTRLSAADAESKKHRANTKARFSPYIVALVLLVFGPLQAALLTSEEGTIEQVLAHTRRTAEEIRALFSVPSAKAAVSSQSLALAGGASLEDQGWSNLVNSLKMLAEQTASERKQAENDQLLTRLEAWMYARTQKSAKLTAACASLTCWKTSLR